MTRALRLSLLFLFCIVLFYGYDRLVEGFSLRQIRSTALIPPADGIADLTLDQKDLLEKEFSQPIHYLGKGCQFYVFETEDQQYVIKFFKHKHLRDWKWALDLPLPSFLHNYLEKKRIKNQKRKDMLFTGCRVGYEYVSEETGIVYLHLQKTNHLKKEVTLTNKIGLSRKMPLDELEFFVQKKGIPAVAFLQKIVRQEPEKIPQVLDKIALAILKRSQKGILDADSALVQNLAFSPLNSEVIFIDIGQYKQWEAAKNPENIHNELVGRFYSLKAWSEKNCPQLAPYIQMKLGEF